MIGPFEKSDDQLRTEFLNVSTRADAARLLDVPLPFLTAVLYRDGVERYYKSWEIKKRSGGYREIRAPHSHVYFLQARLNAVLQAIYKPKASTHGFVRTRSVVTNARPHVGKAQVLNVDLKDFFPSINFGRVRGVLMAGAMSLPPEPATLLAKLCCLDNGLPVGAPTSPVLANMISLRMDVELQRLARRHGCWYTRYADDLTFSTRRRPFPEELAVRDTQGRVVPGEPLSQIIRRNGFEVNTEKVRLQSADQRQTVTGIVVNKKTNVDRRFLREIRAMLHSWDRDGLEGAQSKLELLDSKDRFPGARPPQFKNVLRGKIAYCTMVRGDDDPLSARFLAEYRNLASGRPRTAGFEHRSLQMSASSESRFRVLHLSDFHFRSETAWDSDPMLKGLVDFLAAEVVGLDIVAVTGDIAQSGTTTEYSKAAQWFLGDVAPRLGIDGSQFYFVPGNHDVHRPSTGTLLPALRDTIWKSNGGQGLLAKALQDPDERAIIESRFRNYFQFVKQVNGTDDRSRLWWSTIVKKAGHDVVLSGVCSPLLSYGDEEQGRLFISRYQAVDVTRERGSLNIVMLHHPFTYFPETDQTSQQTLVTWADVVLQGHVHVVGATSVAQHGEGGVLIIGAGASYQGSNFENSCQLLEMDLDSRTCRVRVFRWHPDQVRWIVSRDYFSGSPSGEGEFVLRPRAT